MRLTLIEFVEPGDVLAKTIYDFNGRPLLKRGTTLSNSYVTRLRAMGYTALYVEDVLTHDVMVEDFVPPELKTSLITEVRGMFQGVRQSTRLENVLPDKTANRITDLFKQMLDSIRGDELFELHMGSILNKDESLLNHSFHVALFTTIIATAKKFDAKRIRDIGVGALLHDIGKIVIPDTVLQKEGKLTPEEWELVRSHPWVGYDMIRKQQQFSVVSAHCAYQHHERLDGSGYPRGLVGNDIHPVGRITAIADVFEAMTATRPYKRPILPGEVMEYLYANSGTLFDPEYVQAFRDHVALYPLGVTLELSDGRKGIVVRNRLETPQRPIIRIFAQGNERISPYDFDLNDTINVVVVNFRMSPLLREGSESMNDVALPNMN